MAEADPTTLRHGVSDRKPGVYIQRYISEIQRYISEAYPGTAAPRSKSCRFQLSALIQASRSRARWSDGQRKVPSALLLRPSFWSLASLASLRTRVRANESAPALRALGGDHPLVSP
jgi:hypothetical protein